ncbi:MAG: hypothetical protein ACRCZS_11885 [Chroococcidiopsis sp.]
MAKLLNEVLIRCDLEGKFQGAHVVYVESYSLPSGKPGFELYPPEPLSQSDLENIAPSINAVFLEHESRILKERDDYRSRVEGLVESNENLKNQIQAEIQKTTALNLEIEALKKINEDVKAALEKTKKRTTKP